MMMDLTATTLPTACGYAVMLCLSATGLGNFLAAWELKRQMTRTEKAFERLCQDVGSSRSTMNRESLNKLARAGSPSARVVQKMADCVALAGDELVIESWREEAIQSFLGALERRTNLVLALAPTLGLIWTVTGFLLGTHAVAQSFDPRVLFEAIALALGTTLLGLLNVVIQVITLRAIIEPLKGQAYIRTQEAMAVGRKYFLGRIDSGTGARLLPVPDECQPRLGSGEWEV
jgi:biopolymer transport protein ExbB/TolQ